MNIRTVIGFMAVTTTVAYFMMPKKKAEKAMGGIEINPSKILDGALAMTGMNPIVKEGIKQVANRAINKYMGIA